MKRFAVLALAAAALAFPAAHATAAPSAAPTAAQFKALQKQVRALQAQVKRLQKQTRDLEGFAGATLELFGCQSAVTADALQSTWNVVDQIAQATQGKTYFSAQAPLADKGACKDLKVTRSQAVPPTVAVFSSIVSLVM